MEKKIFLSEKEFPEAWYNVRSEIKEDFPPPLHPATQKPINPEDLYPIFPKSLVQQEITTEKFIEIPGSVKEKLLLWRPTPLVRAIELEKYLKTPARIYYKNESVSPPGSHKPNTAVPQVYYNAIEGIKRITTETGAGQWGSALAFACNLFGIECKVYMVKISYQQKPFRKSLMRLWGANVIPSPSPYTEAGKTVLDRDPSCPGSLGIAISEAVEEAAKNEDTHYSLGSVLNHVLLHQTITGLETIKQFKLVGDYPNVIIGCVGGGSNFAGLAFPFIPEIMKGKNIMVRAIEPCACPTITKGKYLYDFGDTVGLTPLLKMYTLGHNFVPPSIHAGGLRYHGMAPLVSYFVRKKIIQSVAYHQQEVFEAGQIFAKTEGIVPAPETCHAIKDAIEMAKYFKEKNEEGVIVFLFSGHGHFDLTSYDKYLDGDLENYDYPEAQLAQSIKELEKFNS